MPAAILGKGPDEVTDETFTQEQDGSGQLPTHSTFPPTQSAFPPGQSAFPPGQSAFPPGQSTLPPGQSSIYAQMPSPSNAAARRGPYSEGKRVGYGLLWTGWTVLLTIAGFSLLFGGQVLPGLLSLVLAGFAGRYAYRIWTWQAKRLLFFIIF